MDKGVHSRSLCRNEWQELHLQGLSISCNLVSGLMLTDIEVNVNLYYSFLFN